MRDLKIRYQLSIGMLVISILFSIGMTSAVIQWMRENDRLQERLIEAQMEAQVYKQSVELMKNHLRKTSNEIVSVSSKTEIHKKITSDELIEDFVSRKLPEMEMYLSDFLALADEYKIDSGFALATVILETGWLRSKAWAQNNNPAGLTCTYGYCKYKTKQQGLERMFERLSQYVNGEVKWIGMRRTVDEVRSKWSETEDTDLIIELWNLILQN